MASLLAPLSSVLLRRRRTSTRSCATSWRCCAGSWGACSSILAINPLGQALYAPAFATPQRPVNLARFCFLDPAAEDYYPNWDDAANTNVALLRTEAGRDPYDRALTDLVGELATRSEPFRTLWAAHDVRLHHTGVKQFHHPVVGLLSLGYEAMPLPADPGLTMTAYHAEPGSPSQDGLRLLASWAATGRGRAGRVPPGRAGC